MASPTQLFNRSSRGAARFLMQDCPIAARVLLRRRAFLVTGVLSLALAIGTSTAAFSVVDAIRFRSLPLRDGDRLVAIIEVAVPVTAPARAPSPDCSRSCDVSYRTYSTVLRTQRLLSLNGVAAFTAGIKASPVVVSVCVTPVACRFFLGEGHDAHDHDHPPSTMAGFWKQRST